MEPGISCQELVELTTDFLEGALPAGQRDLFEAHTAACEGCRNYLKQMQQMIHVLGSFPPQPIPGETRDKLRKLFQAAGPQGRQSVPLGIGDASVELGEHIAYFWQSEDDFNRAIGFLEAGLEQNDFCVIFGHDEANRKLLDLLRARGVDPRRLIEARRLCVVGGGPTGESMLASIAVVFQDAIKMGARAIRLLGNIGWGREGWPHDDDILAFEARVTEAAKQFPCVVVCMYDVMNLAGRIILKGGFETHPLTVCDHTLRENPLHVPTESFLARLAASPASNRVQ